MGLQTVSYLRQAVGWFHVEVVLLAQQCGGRHAGNLRESVRLGRLFVMADPLPSSPASPERPTVVSAANAYRPLTDGGAIVLRECGWSRAECLPLGSLLAAAHQTPTGLRTLATLPE